MSSKANHKFVLTMYNKCDTMYERTTKGQVIFMAKTDTIHIRVNEETKNNAEQILAMLGLTISDAVNMLLCQVNLTGSLPFQVQLPSPQNVIVNSRADIERKLNEAEQDIADGNISAADEAFARLESKYAL